MNRTLAANLVFSVVWILVDVFLFRIENPYSGKLNFHGLLNAALIFIQAVIGMCICYFMKDAEITQSGLQRRLANFKVFNRVIFLVNLALEVFVVILILTKGNDYTISSVLSTQQSAVPGVEHGTLHIKYFHSPLQLYVQFFVSILAILLTLALCVTSTQLVASAHRLANLDRLMTQFMQKGSQLVPDN